jgi:polyhydroxyalkanoate synthase
MKTLLIVAFLLTAFLVILRLLAQRYVSDRKPDRVHYAQTVDGWPIALSRYLPKGEPKDGAPVILCHGLGANRFNFDLNDQVSFAKILSEQGYDTFLIELRGVGLSRRTQWFWPGKWDIRFEDFIDKDIPTAIDHVLKLTGKKKVHWVGHSMGAMVSYAFCQKETAKKIQSVSAVAGPGTFAPLIKTFRPFLNLAIILKIFPALHQSFFFKGFGVLSTALNLSTPYDRWVYNRKHVSKSTLRQAASSLIADLPTRLILQFGDWIKNGQITTSDQERFQENFDRIKVPFLFLSGENDRLVPFESVRYVYDRVSSKDKKHVHFSEESGTLDFGHGDIVVGEQAPVHVFPVILKWLRAHH